MFRGKGKAGYCICISIVDGEFGVDDIAFYHTWSRVTTNHTLLPFLSFPDPALLLPLRARFLLSRSRFWKCSGPTALDPGIDPLKPSCVYFHHPLMTRTTPPSAAATDTHHRSLLRIFRPRFQRERVHSIIQRFCGCMCINGSGRR
jgi:hypothetical protein